MSGLWDPGCPRDPRGEVLARGSPDHPEGRGARGAAHATRAHGREAHGGQRVTEGPGRPESPGRRRRSAGPFVRRCRSRGSGVGWGGEELCGRSALGGADPQPSVPLRSCSLFGFGADFRHLTPSGRKPHLPPGSPPGLDLGTRGSLPRGPGDCWERSRQPCAPSLHPSSAPPVRSARTSLFLPNSVAQLRCRTRSTSSSKCKHSTWTRPKLVTCVAKSGEREGRVWVCGVGRQQAGRGSMRAVTTSISARGENR